MKHRCLWLLGVLAGCSNAGVEGLDLPPVPELDQPAQPADRDAGSDSADALSCPASTFREESGRCARWRLAGARRFYCGEHTASRTGQAVVVVGNCGFEAEAPTVGAWIYRIQDDSWSQLESPIPPRFGHAAVTLPDGRVLIAGGLCPGGALLAGAMIFDPESNSWAPGGSLHSPRARSSATVLPDGRVLLAGGIESMSDEGTADSSAVSEIFDPATLSWALGSPLASARYGHGAVVAPKGKVMVMGGYLYRSPCCDRRTVLDSTELFDTSDGSWIDGPPLPASLPLLTSALSTDAGQILVVSSAVYRLGRDGWEASEAFTRPYPAVAELSDARILIVGDSVWENIRTPQIYRLQDQGWENGPDMIEWGGHTGNASATRLPAAQGILVIGGGPAQIFEESPPEPLP